MANPRSSSGAPYGDHRFARLVLLAYLAFILYGSFFPFQFTTSPEAIRDRLGSVVVLPWESPGGRTFSIADLVSNVFLGAPFGLLLVGGRLVGASLIDRIVRIAGFDVLLAGSIELAQLLVPGRTTSLLDVGGQVVGSIAGGIVGHIVLRGSQGSVGPWVLAQLGRRPALGPALLLIVVLAADALYPYAPTLDLSSLRESVKAGAWTPLGGPSRLPWHAVAVEGILPYTVLAGLLLADVGGKRVLRSPARALAVGIAVAMGLELGKLFIEGRAPSLDRVLLAIAGLLVGVLLVPSLRPLTESGWRGWAFAVAAFGLLAYEQLTPFSMVWSLSALRARAEGIEWTPFAAYYWTDAPGALFDAGKKLLLGGLFGAALLATGRRGVLLATVLAGAALEAVKLFSAFRHPSVTAVMLLAVGAAAGRSLSLRYWRAVFPAPSPEPGMLDSRRS